MCMRKQMMNIFLPLKIQCAKFFNHHESALAEDCTCLSQCRWSAPALTCSQLVRP